jgi:hypothetical protein
MFRRRNGTDLALLRKSSAFDHAAARGLRQITRFNQSEIGNAGG